MILEGIGVGFPAADAKGGRGIGVRRHPLFHVLSNAANLLTITALLLTLYGAGWEFATRQYLRGFADAIVPQSGTPLQKVEAILSWMQRGPARQSPGAGVVELQRDPEDTLNYGGLLGVCGTATNAFVNLADASGLHTRRLLLLGANGEANHVVAEVLINGRWIVVDPAFRRIMADSQGNFLTSEQLQDQTTFRAATGGIAGYDPRYNYQHTEHVRIEAVPIVGRLLRKGLDFAEPSWETSLNWAIVLERQSMIVLLSGVALLIGSCLMLKTVRIYGRAWIGEPAPTLREYITAGAAALLGTSTQGAEY